MSAKVELIALKAAKGGVSVCKHEITEAIRTLKQQYQNAGMGWKDEKYQKLGDIIEECCDALNKPVNDLYSCGDDLDALIRAVSAYEDAL